MNLREKIGQMLIIGFNGKSVTQEDWIAKAIHQHNIGGVILFDYDPYKKSFDKNIDNPEQVQQLNRQLQQITQTANHQQGRPDLPLFISVDYEGGYVNRLKESYGFPATQSPAAVGTMQLQEAGEIAAQMAMTLKAAGFNIDFAPLLDVNVNPNNPIIGKLGRSFSNDPNTVAKYAQVYREQLHRQGVKSVYKHFPGHGSSDADSHEGFVDVTDTWQAIELQPYQSLFANGDSDIDMVMTAHVINRRLDPSGLPATLSKTMLTGILREQLKFAGVIISDDMQMKAIRDHFPLDEALLLAIEAGVDQFIFGNQLVDQAQDPEAVIDIIVAGVHSGRIDEQRINESYQRIESLKTLV